MEKPKYPAVKVKLAGMDGNAFSILARVKVAMLKAGLPPAEFERFHAEATAGNYDKLLQTCMRWCDAY